MINWIFLGTETIKMHFVTFTFFELKLVKQRGGIIYM